MRVLVLDGLGFGKHQKAAQKVIQAIERDDFRSADVKKLTGGSHYYRARLDYENRLLLRFAERDGVRSCFVVELIEGHKYERSRFLRGVKLSPEDLADDRVAMGSKDAAETHSAETPIAFEPMRYVHPERAQFHFLDRPLSFDDFQDAALRQAPPLLILGSAGSGKTAVSLLRLRQEQGSVAYVTQSPYLAEAARSLYHHTYEDAAERELCFLPFRDLLALIEAPSGRGVRFADFRPFFDRHRHQVKFADAHRTFEEFRGVIGAQPEGMLTKGAYLALGIRQSIFSASERESVWALYQTYRAWLTEQNLYDANLVAHALMQKCPAMWDFLLIDEVQDFTNAELALCMKGLRDRKRFLLTGDANQIVHPNFFSWANLRSMFFREASEVHAATVLPANYRNASTIVDLANRVLTLKKARFGSVDRESDALSEPRTAEPGAVQAYPSSDANLRALDEATRRSTKACVLVLRDEDRAEAKKRYRTPLVFAVHEAKGLEYDTVILHELISSAREAFAEVCQGVTLADLREDRSYGRAKDKDDKSLEVYKFFTNALFVAITRAMGRVVIVEKDTRHPVFGLLAVPFLTGPVDLKSSVATLEEWQMEARKLELQGKAEQADAIRKEILRLEPVPWTVMDAGKKQELEDKAFKQGDVFKKAKQQVWDLAAFYDDAPLAFRAEMRARYVPQTAFEPNLPKAQKLNHAAYYASDKPADVLRLVDKHGVNFRSMMNLTPLMHAAYAGNVTLARELIGRGADLQLRDTYGATALHWLFQRSASLTFSYTGRKRSLDIVGEIPHAPKLVPDAEFLNGPFADLYALVSESTIDVRIGDRLVRIGKDQGEYVVFQTLMAFARRIAFREPIMPDQFVQSAKLEPFFEALPAQVLPDWRKKRAYINGVLARSEASATYATGRKLWTRERHGHYFINRDLSFRVNEGEYVPMADLLGITQVETHLMDPPKKGRGQARAPTATPVTPARGGQSVSHSVAPLHTLLGRDHTVPDAAYQGLLGAQTPYLHTHYQRDLALAFGQGPQPATKAEQIEAAVRLYDHSVVYLEHALTDQLTARGLEMDNKERVAALMPEYSLFENKSDAAIAQCIQLARAHPVDVFGLTPLHKAALLGNTQLTEALAKVPGAKEVRDFYGARPIERALSGYRMEVYAPGTLIPIVPLLLPSDITVMLSGKVTTEKRGSPLYTVLLLVTAMARQTISNSRGSRPEMPIEAVVSASELLRPALFESAAPSKGYVRDTLQRFAYGQHKQLGVFVLQPKTDAVLLHPMLAIEIDGNHVPTQNLFRLDDVLALGRRRTRRQG
jgi:Ankyrin repeats (many copies)